MSFLDLYTFYVDNEDPEEPVLCPHCGRPQSWVDWMKPDSDFLDNQIALCIYEDCDRPYTLALTFGVDEVLASGS